ncbi:MAG: glycosyltransferase family A protein [Terracidiphilus sp.]
MSSKPLVSVVMPVRNGMPFLPEAVESIRSQTWPNWELIVVDDHSTDGTASYLAQLTDPRIRAIKSAGCGFEAARTSGIQVSRGEFVARLDADDVAMPERLEMQVAFLTRNPEFVGVGTQVEFVTAGAAVPGFRYPLTPQRILANLRSGLVTMCDSSMMFRTCAVCTVRSTMPGPGADFDLLLRLSAHGHFGNLPQRLMRLRVSRSSMSFSNVDQQLCGIAFALARDRARRSHLPEPDFAEFQRAWENRPIWRRFLTKLRTRHQRFFRNAVMYRAAGNTIHALAYLSASAVLWPPAVWYQLKRALAREDPETYEVPPGPAAYHHQR